MKTIKGYKAFDKGLRCRDFQYKEGETYEVDNAEMCKEGFHFCENPFDVLNYYELTESEFAEVEALGKVETNGDKSVTAKIKIGAKLDLSAFIECSIGYLFEKNKATSGDSSRLAASEYSSQLAASGDYSQLATSGDSSQLATSGYSSRLAASGDYSQLAASGDYSKLAASGSSSQLAASGDSSKLEMSGKNNVGANIGIGGLIKGKNGDWITLAEYKDGKCLSVKSVKIDGKKIKEDVWYKLIDNKFTKYEV